MCMLCYAWLNQSIKSNLYCTQNRNQDGPKADQCFLGGEHIKTQSTNYYRGKEGEWRSNYSVERSRKRWKRTRCKKNRKKILLPLHKHCNLKQSKYTSVSRNIQEFKARLDGTRYGDGRVWVWLFSCML